MSSEGSPKVGVLRFKCVENRPFKGADQPNEPLGGCRDES